MFDFEEMQSEGLNLDRSNWNFVRFGDVAIKQNVSVDRENTKLTRYVKGEHMNSQDLHLRKWGELTDEYLGPAFTRKFEKGDILYGSRRTYLRKVVIAPFEGITSNTTFVIKANEEKIDKRLLPFLMMSEGFTQHSIRNSKGSVNPYINWKDIANYEFSLPDKPVQKKMVELLLAGDTNLEKQVFVDRKLKRFFQSQQNQVMSGEAPAIVKKAKSQKAKRLGAWKEYTIGDLLDQKYIVKIQDGNHGEIHPKSASYIDDGIPFVMANTLVDGVIDFSKSKKLPKTITDTLRIGFAVSGDVLLSHKGTVGEAALIPNNIAWPYLMLTPQVTFYRVNSEMLFNKFLFYIFTSDYFQKQLKAASSQSTRAYIGITAQRNLKVLLPSTVEEQHAAVELLDETNIAINELAKAIATTKQLQGSIVKAVFS